jgi:hypothetical protein
LPQCAANHPSTSPQGEAATAVDDFIKFASQRSPGRDSLNRELDFGTRAMPAADPNNRLEDMKPIVQTANIEAEPISLREVIPFWFAVSSPLLGALLGLLGAWFVAWVST